MTVISTLAQSPHLLESERRKLPMRMKITIMGLSPAFAGLLFVEQGALQRLRTC